MPTQFRSVRLRKPLERAVRQGHPWIYKDALEPFEADCGDVATVFDRKRHYLARGLFDQGTIAVRVWTTGPEPIDEHLFLRRLQDALQLRQRLNLPQTDALRLVHGENDRMPGLVLDRYAHYAVIKLDGESLIPWRETLVAALRPELEHLGIQTLIERRGRQTEKETQVWWGQQPDQAVVVNELGMRLSVDLLKGQKTGLFLDHRDSRLCIRKLAHGCSVLNLFGYNGAFSVAAGLGGATRVVTVDSAKGAIAAAHDNWLLNALDGSQHEAVCAEVESYLAQERKRFDIVISDPPSFAPNQAAVPKALHAYRSLHRNALRKVERGGWFLAASCSSHIDAEAFMQTVTDAAHDLKCRLSDVSSWGAAADHPVLDAFPEGSYLKSVLVRVV